MTFLETCVVLPHADKRHSGNFVHVQPVTFSAFVIILKKVTLAPLRNDVLFGLEKSYLKRGQSQPRCHF
jgi:hypothetical protein